MKRGKTLLSVALLLFMTFILAACSSGPPSNIVESGIEMKATESSYVVWEMTDYDITDETVEERDGREYYYYNADVELEYVEAKGMVEGLFGKKGDVETKTIRIVIWKEGNDWKVRKA